jgi:predicted Fe-Mo cluster-binding NifX family protein
MGPDLSSAVDPRFGRAEFFIIYDTGTNGFESISNVENASAAQGAGVQAAQLVVSFKADVVVSGNIGPKAFAALQAAGVKIATFSDGPVSEAIELARNGELEIRGAANVRGHWS